MEQRIRQLRRRVYAAGLLACTSLLAVFGGLAWLELRAAARDSEAALDLALRTVGDLTASARNEAFERLAIAGRQVNAELHAAAEPASFDTATAQNRLDSASYVVGVGATLLRWQSGRLVALASSSHRGDGVRERVVEADLDPATVAELQRGRSWSGVLQRNGAWLAVSIRPLDPPFADTLLRLDTPLPLRDVERYLASLESASMFIVLHDAAGRVRLRTRSAPDAESIDQIGPLLRLEDWVRFSRDLGDTELSVLAAYRPLAGARRPFALFAAGLWCAILSGGLLLRYAWRQTQSQALAPLRDIDQLAAELQRGRSAYALTQCARRDEIGVLAGALVKLAHAGPPPSHEATPRVVGASA